ncbi:MAG: DUF4347 domain-containing protein, partial [Gammaproteobacteria bacterium]|nr:DUF4347 domain-containing protein [Gammaproteobacteria bacterium]
MGKKTSVSNTRLVFEEIEPRLLLSADGLAVITESSVATFQNIVHSDNEHTIIVRQHDEQVSTAVLNKAHHDQRTELVILDSRAPNYQQLHNDVIKAQQSGRDINVVILDAHRDGIEQISEALSKYNKLDAVHIVSHGSDSQLQLGATQLDKQNIQQRSKEIETWKHVFTDGGDLLIYGCNLADTNDGKAMVNRLSSLTATDVAASDDLTGNKLLGGDWELEYNVGDVETKIAFSENAQQQWQGSLASPVANNDSYSVAEDQTLIVNALTENATASDLEAAWQFDEGAGTTTADATGNGNEGTLNGTTWTTSSRTGNAALSFDGTNDYVQTASSTVDLSTAMNFTLSAWFQTDTTSGQQHILWQGVSTENGWGTPSIDSPLSSEMNLTVGHWDPLINDKITFFLGYHDLTVPDSINIISTSTFTDTTAWHQAVVVVSDLGGGTLQADLYVDGVLEGSDTGTQIDRSLWDTDLRIGQGGPAGRNFDGMIDEVGVYDRALTSTEVANLYQTGVIANDTDVEGDALAASVVDQPLYGTLSLNTDGSFTYTPDTDFSGADLFTYRVHDGTSYSNIATVNITVTPVNDAPILDLDADNSSGPTGNDFDTTFIEAGGAISIVDSDLLLIDADDSLESITVRLINNQVNAPNMEILDATDPDGTGLTINYDGKEFLTITGTATVADYQSVLSTLTYNNLVNNPDTTPRTITFVVNDGSVNSPTATTTVAITQSTKPPTNTVPGAQTVAEDTSLAISGVSIKDTDNNLTSVALIVNNGSLNVTLMGGVIISSGANDSNTLTLSGGTVAEFNNTLATLAYQGDLNFNGADSLTVISTDALGGVDSDAVSITVTPVDDAPVAADDPGDYGTDISSLNPLSYWRFGEAGGGAVTDEGSTGVSASLSGATLGQPGAINGDTNTAAGFDGVDDFAVIAKNDAYKLDDGSIQLWFNADDVSTQQGLISKDSSGFDNG